MFKSVFQVQRERYLQKGGPGSGRYPAGSGKQGGKEYPGSANLEDTDRGSTQEHLEAQDKLSPDGYDYYKRQRNEGAGHKEALNYLKRSYGADSKK